MKKTYSQKEVLILLHKRGIATFSASSFCEAVKRGQIPYVIPDGTRRKRYIYNDVKRAIIRAGIGGIKDGSNRDKLSMNDRIDMISPPKNGEHPQEYGKKAIAELGDNPTMTDVNIYKTIYSGKIEKLKYEKESGQLISREEVEDKAFVVARAIRDKLMGLPERLSDELASISDVYVIKEMLYKEIGNILEGFSKDSFYEN